MAMGYNTLVGGVADGGNGECWSRIEQMRGMIQGLDDVANLIVGMAMIAAIMAILAGAIQLAFWPQDPEQTRAAKVISVLHSNWRGLIIVAVPLFYPAIRRFIEEVEELPGVKRRTREDPQRRV